MLIKTTTLNHHTMEVSKIKKTDHTMYWWFVEQLALSYSAIGIS